MSITSVRSAKRKEGLVKKLIDASLTTGYVSTSTTGKRKTEVSATKEFKKKKTVSAVQQQKNVVTAAQNAASADLFSCVGQSSISSQFKPGQQPLSDGQQQFSGGQQHPDGRQQFPCGQQQFSGGQQQFPGGQQQFSVGQQQFPGQFHGRQQQHFVGGQQQHFTGGQFPEQWSENQFLGQPQEQSLYVNDTTRSELVSSWNVWSSALSEASPDPVPVAVQPPIQCQLLSSQFQCSTAIQCQLLSSQLQSSTAIQCQLLSSQLQSCTAILCQLLSSQLQSSTAIQCQLLSSQLQSSTTIQCQLALLEKSLFLCPFQQLSSPPVQDYMRQLTSYYNQPPLSPKVSGMEMEWKSPTTQSPTVNKMNSPAEQRRTSPRKQLYKQVTPSPALNESMEATSSHVHLVESYDVMAHRATVISARNYSSQRFGDRPGFALMGKLLPALFSNSQLAESCGQGLQKKKSDNRPPLDKNKIAACKEYTTAWCLRKGAAAPADKELNDAITERVSYARKKRG